MKTLQIKESKARSIYKTASSELKIMLEDIFGKEFFSREVAERIKTYEDACAELDIAPIDESVLLSNGFTKDEIAYRKIKTITEALNEGWKPNWNNEKQKKWVPYFYPNSSSGFVFDGTDYDYSNTNAGNRLHLCKILKRQKPCPLAKNNNSKGVGRVSENSDKKSKAMKRIGNLYDKVIEEDKTNKQ